MNSELFEIWNGTDTELTSTDIEWLILACEVEQKRFQKMETRLGKECDERYEKLSQKLTYIAQEMGKK